MLGIALAALLAIGAAVMVSVKTGIVIPGRWFGLIWWTSALLWFVFKQHKHDLRCGRFWLVFLAFLAAHLTIFVFVLQAYPAWRMAWFMFIFMIEAPLVLVSMQTALRPRRNRRQA